MGCSKTKAYHPSHYHYIPVWAGRKKRTVHIPERKRNVCSIAQGFGQQARAFEPLTLALAYRGRRLALAIAAQFFVVDLTEPAASRRPLGRAVRRVSHRL